MFDLFFRTASRDFADHYPQQDSGKRGIFIRGLPRQWGPRSQSVLLKLFGVFGKIEHIELKGDGTAGIFYKTHVRYRAIVVTVNVANLIYFSAGIRSRR